MAYTISFAYKLNDLYSRAATKIANRTIDIESAAKCAATAINKLGSSLQRSGVNYTRLNKNIKESNRQINKSKKFTTQLSESVNKSSYDVRKNAINTRRSLRGISNEAERVADRYLASTAKMASGNNRISRTAARAAASVSGLQGAEAGKKIKKKEGVFSQIAGAAGAGAAAVAIASTAKSALAFESVMIELDKLKNFKTPEELGAMKSELLGLSKTLGLAPIGMAQIAVEGAKLGLPTAELKDFSMLVGKVSSAFDIAPQAAGAAVAGIKTRFELGLKGTENLMDSINYLADRSATTTKAVTEVLARTSGAWSALKIPPKFAAAWSTVAAQLAVSPELAASGIEMMIARMKTIPRYQNALLKDPQQAIIKMFREISSKSARGRMKFIEKTFGAEAGKLVTAMAGKMGLIEKAIGHVSKESKFSGSMAAELKKKLEGAPAAVDKIKASFESLKITIGDEVLPIIKEFSEPIQKAAESVEKFIKSNPEIVKFGLAFAGVTAGITAVGLAVTALTAALAAPAMPIITAVAAIVTGLTFIYNNSERIRKEFSKLGESLTPLFEKIKGINAEIEGPKEDKGFGFFDYIKKKAEDFVVDYPKIFTGLSELAMTGLFDKKITEDSTKKWLESIGALVRKSNPMMLIMPRKEDLPDPKALVKDLKGWLKDVIYEVTGGRSLFEIMFNLLGGGKYGGGYSYMTGQQGGGAGYKYGTQQPKTAAGGVVGYGYGARSPGVELGGTSSTINGKIVVEAAPGTKVKSSEIKHDLPGNLGLNMG